MELFKEDADEFSITNVLYDMIPSNIQAMVSEDVWDSVSEGSAIFESIKDDDCLCYSINDNGSELIFDYSPEGKKEANTYIEQMIIEKGYLVPDTIDALDIILVPCIKGDGPRDYYDGLYIRTADDFGEYIDESVFAEVIVLFNYPEQVVKFMKAFVKETSNEIFDHMSNVYQKAQFIGIILFTEEQQYYIRSTRFLEDALLAKVYVGEKLKYAPTINDKIVHYFKPDPLLQLHISKTGDISRVLLGIVFGNVLREYIEKGGK